MKKPQQKEVFLKTKKHLMGEKGKNINDSFSSDDELMKIQYIDHKFIGGSYFSLKRFYKNEFLEVEFNYFFVDSKYSFFLK